jgi:hypothetical protein
MNIHWAKRSAIVAMSTLLFASAMESRAQDTGLLPSVPQQAAALTGDQQQLMHCARLLEVIFRIPHRLVRPH